MKSAVYLAVMSIAVFSSALASEPPAPAVQAPAAQAPAVQAPAVQAPAVQAPAADAAAAAPAKTETVAAAKSAVTDAQINQMRSRGYKPVVHNGTMVFCKSSSEIGTRFPVTRCSTLEELNATAQSGKDFTEHFQQQASATPPGK